MEGLECFHLIWERTQHIRKPFVSFFHLVFVLVESGWVLIWIPGPRVVQWHCIARSTVGRLVNYRPTRSAPCRVRL